MLHSARTHLLRALAVALCSLTAHLTALHAQARPRANAVPQAGCASRDPTSVLSLLRAARSIRLLEADSAPIVSSLPSIAVSRRGLVAVADERDSNVKLFDSEGRLQRVLGRRGDGPGEYRGPSAVGFVSDGTLVVADDMARRLVLVDTAGAVLWHTALRPARTGSIVITPSWLAIAGYIRGESAARPLSLLQFVSPTGDTLGVGLEVPPTYRTRPALFAGPVYAANDARDSIIFVTFRFANHLMSVAGRDGPVHVLQLPSEGGFVNPIEVLTSVGGQQPERFAESASPIIGLTASSRLVLVAYAARGSGRLRYHVLTRDLNVVGSGLSGPRFVASTGDTLVGQGPADAANGSGVALTWYVPCSRND